MNLPKTVYFSELSVSGRIVNVNNELLMADNGTKK